MLRHMPMPARCAGGGGAGKPTPRKNNVALSRNAFGSYLHGLRKILAGRPLSGDILPRHAANGEPLGSHSRATMHEKLEPKRRLNKTTKRRSGQRLFFQGSVLVPHLRLLSERHGQMIGLKPRMDRGVGTFWHLNPAGHPTCSVLIFDALVHHGSTPVHEARDGSSST